MHLSKLSEIYTLTSSKVEQLRNENQEILTSVAEDRKMNSSFIEHVNLTVSDPQKTAQMLCDLFGWTIRWEGPSLGDGYTVHVGTDKHYLAVYSRGDSGEGCKETYVTKGGLNHIGIVVDDIAAAERRVIEAGYIPENHGDYEPGKRFYFDDHDGIEFEVVSYEAKQ